MEIEIKKGRYRGVVPAPPSKSDAHRLLICGGLSEGTSVIHGVSDSEDMKATLDCLAALGAVYEKTGDTVTVEGASPFLREKELFPCRESGSTLRFFLPLCLLSERRAFMTGSPTLLSRPLDVYEEICLGQGLLFEREEEGLLLQGPLSGGAFKIPGGISSQFVSGLMFALPLLEDYSLLELISPVASRSYIDMTVDALGKFGVRAELTEENSVILPGKQKYRPAEVTAEGDWSNAAFFLAMEALGQDITVTGLDRETYQGDAVVKRLLPRLGRCRPTVDIENCPDLAPVLMAVSAAMNGADFVNTDRLKIKESDRGQAMAEELAKFGVRVTVGDNVISVDAPRELRTPKEKINGHNDHRIVMACAVLLTLTGGVLAGAEAVRKSYPDFFSELLRLRDGE